MRGFFVGLLVGVFGGAGGVYVALEKPWQSEPVVSVGQDAGVAARRTGKKRRRRKRRRGARGARETYRVTDKPPELSAADRKLVWRGGPVRLPSQSVDFAADEGARSLSSSEINGVIRRRSGGVLDCIKKSRGAAQLSSSVTLKMLVDGTGAVKKVAVRGPAYLFAHGFSSCARAAARRMRYPGHGKYTVVTAPYTLE